jgi:sulfopyruvate decarboxylase subunit alpha
MSQPEARAGSILDVLAARGIDLIVTVPCKYFAHLLVAAAGDDRFEVVQPAREEEGLAIAAGAWLAGRKPLLLIQNSGLGNLVNVYGSLGQYYDIPAALLLSHRGDAGERVPAQVPMGRLTTGLLDLLGVERITLETPGDLDALDAGLRRYTERDRPVALLGKKGFWLPS